MGNPGSASESAGTNTPQSSEKPPNSGPQYPPPYQDDIDARHELEADAAKANGGSFDLVNRDIELGNVPLLPAEEYDFEDSDSEFDFEEADEHQFRRDPPFSCTFAGFCAWLRGPSPPHVYHINPWFPRWHAAPTRLIDRLVPRMGAKIGLLFLGLVFWIVVFFSSLKASVAGQEVLGYGQPVKLSCNHRLWNNATDCGINGDLCQPFDAQSFAFRCPAGCAQEMLLEPYYVGGEEYNYRPLVIGGKPFRLDGHNSGIYRGDSSICASALHAGMISDAKGGCGILRRQGMRDNFQSFVQNGIESIEFLSYFPMSFVLSKEASSSGASSAKPVECSDIRWPLFAFTVLTTVVFSMTVTSAPVFYSIIYFIVWFQVAMASDPPTSGYYNLVSVGLGRFLPGAFVGFALYYFCVRHTLQNLDAHIDKTIFWLGGCWVGALNTNTFDRIPISRLTPHDIQQQPGAVTALVMIVGFLIAVFFLQAHAFRREGNLLSKLRLYGFFVLIILILIAVPHMNLRIHHYILALVFLPGTTLQTRPSLLFQGILIGLFINGIARWGFDSILQTPASLLDGGKLGTVAPVISPPTMVGPDHLVFSFPQIPANVDGISVIVNDVQRFQQLKGKDQAGVPDFPWTRARPNAIEYFRFGYVHLNSLGGVWYEDFSNPATWMPGGNYSYLE
ncbi:hypothetical protein N7466_000420 [Penicillium verhagenii]|uniref:uncharacterized protein n=1 Tax=Penicillium verhagenii TaxID=1562060 RepID=UPI002544DB7F|nr:uncharacterized protein N7466_000420 [Penicillium verhagenii]KAJ5947405.1 hypothetical protein N7466_000420 [Penicillium verhagenii]